MFWKVYGIQAEPLFTGMEDEAKKFYADSEENEDLYVQDPDGGEWMMDARGRWIPAT